MTRAALLAALALALLAGTYAMGRTHKEAELLAEIARAREAARETQAALERQRLAIEAERAITAAQLEDAARATPVTSPDCLPADRVRRLDSLR